MDIRIQKSIEVINFIIKDLNFENPKQFSEALGFERPERIYKILRGKASISRNLASIINNKYPQFSKEWLLTGTKETLDDIYYEKNGVKFFINEIINFVAEEEEEFMKRKIFSNIIEVRVAKKLAEITATKESLLAYLGKK
ncbi:hypothetical protein [Tenacibaculum amylolyticum]|uniref:hypothetical protein n=1 Tax=Tenacibaculum amylolyticum TaxID=104269 RepID=UPI00389516AC